MTTPGSCTKNPRIEEVIDLELYPIHDAAARKELIDIVRGELKEDGACTLPGFVTDNALGAMVEQAHGLLPLAYAGPTEATPYFFDYDLGGGGSSIDKNHPLRRTSRRNLSQVAADLIPGQHLLARLHRAELMLDFLSAVEGQPVYRNEDPYQGLNISVMEEGGCQQWHFDGGNMVITLLLQAPIAGGEFEYVPGIRTESKENFDEIRAVMEGDQSRVRRIRPRAGALNLFKGRYSLHRVTEVLGDRRRLQAILGYTTVMGYRGSLKSSILHYGPRVASREAQVGSPS